MSDTITLDFLARQQTQILVEQRMLRGLVDPLPTRLSALEARFSALEARFGGVEEGINGIGLALRHQSELLAKLGGRGVMHIIGIIAFAIVMAFLIEKWLDERSDGRKLNRAMRRDDW